MTQREDVARALTFFERTEDLPLLHQLVQGIAPRAKRLVGQHLAQGTEESIPAPAQLRAAREPASRDQAIRTVRAVNDFALLQVLARAIGQRIEAAEIAASADFPEGARVEVPDSRGYPPAGARHRGSVEGTGTMLTVRLDNGETWEGPPTLATLVGTP